MSGTGINFFKLIREKLGQDAERVTSEAVTSDDLFSCSTEIYVRELAFWSCTNIIANAVSKCEFRTFLQNKEVKQGDYYLWNYEPNQNQSASAFLHKWVSMLYRNNEALVVEHDGRLFVADSFQRTARALYDDVFAQVTIGDFVFSRTFSQQDVLYLQLNQQDMFQITAGLHASYQKLIDCGIKAYRRSRGSRGTLSTPAINDEKTRAAYANLLNNDFKRFFMAENAVLPLQPGMVYTDMSGNKTYSTETTRDLRAMIDDVCDFTARGFGIPALLVNGAVQDTEKAAEQLITNAIRPLLKMMEEEINRKRYGKAGVLAGSYVKIDTRNIRHYDMFSISAALDKLVASGAFSINDIRRALGEQPINEPWADQHFMTKNYTEITEELMAALKGGESG